MLIGILGNVLKNARDKRRGQEKKYEEGGDKRLSP
jgi:hypothetical protein